MTTLVSFIRPIALAALCAVSGISSAALVTYNTQASFLAATTAQGVDGYNGFSITGTTPSPVTRNAGTYTYRASVGGGGSGLFFGAGTTANPWLSTNSATDFIFFDNFSPSISAIGGNFFGSNISGLFQLGSILLEATDTSGMVSSTLLNATTSTFFGFVSTTSMVSLKISSVQPTGAFLWPTVDNLTLGQRLTQVPEPATLALVAFGLLAAVGARRRA
jgi:hypothetical protein